MADLHITETCSCGASITVTGSAFRSSDGGGSPTNGSQRSAEEVAERWRIEHMHVFAAIRNDHESSDSEVTP